MALDKDALKDAIEKALEGDDVSKIAEELADSIDDYIRGMEITFKVTGKAAEISLGKANLTCNKNGIPFDTEKMTITSGIRLGSQAATTRGFGLNEFKKVGELITTVIKGLSESPDDNSKIESKVRKEVIELCSKFPIYNHLFKN